MDAIARSVQGGMIMRDILRKIMHFYPDAFINRNFEMILVPKSNTYFSLEDCKTELDVKCKLLEYGSRCACKEEPYKRECLNEKFQENNRYYLSCVLDTFFDEEDMYRIYTELGNGINRKLTLKFIESGYDTSLLKGEEWKIMNSSCLQCKEI
jgi:hypothetical protein